MDRKGKQDRPLSSASSDAFTGNGGFGGRGGRNGRLGGGSGGGGGGLRSRDNAQRGQAPALYMFVTRDRVPRHQHDLRAFVMAARKHAKIGKLSEVESIRACSGGVGIGIHNCGVPGPQQQNMYACSMHLVLPTYARLFGQIKEPVQVLSTHDPIS